MQQERTKNFNRLIVLSREARPSKQQKKEILNLINLLGIDMNRNFKQIIKPKIEEKQEKLK